MFSGVTPIPPSFHPERRDLVAPMRTGRRGSGWPTRGQAQRDRYRRTSHGYYVPFWVDSSLPEQRILEAASLDRGNAYLTGWGGIALARRPVVHGDTTGRLVPAR